MKARSTTPRGICYNYITDDNHLFRMLGYLEWMENEIDVSRQDLREVQKEYLNKLKKRDIILKDLLTTQMDVGDWLEEMREVLQDIVSENREMTDYKAGQVWTDPNHPLYTVRIVDVYLNGTIKAVINDGRSEFKMDFYADGTSGDRYHKDIKLTILKGE